MKVFISQPMNGKTTDEILKERAKVVEAIKNMFPADDIEVLDSFFEDAPHEAAPLWFLGESIKLLGKADLVFFCPGWANARGCRVEHMCATEYGKDIYGYL